ncbi:hypothetical protein [Marinomonas arenicola]|uniref:Uncharacterized protein n=1 Tax=Marinomonas arenicola TaxID=569601 RepID=A0ABU9G150_9GAMM
MAISPISNSDWHKLLPSKSSHSGFSNQTDSSHARSTLHLSSQARFMSDQFQQGADVKPNQEFVSLSSSVRAPTRWLGLSHEEAIAIYRSIEAMANKSEQSSR